MTALTVSSVRRALAQKLSALCKMMPPTSKLLPVRLYTQVMMVARAISPRMKTGSSANPISAWMEPA